MPIIPCDLGGGPGAHPQGPNYFLVHWGHASPPRVGLRSNEAWVWEQELEAGSISPGGMDGPFPQGSEEGRPQCAGLAG